VLHDVALAMPPHDEVRLVGAFNQALSVDSLDDVPASMVLDFAGIHTATELLAVMRGLSTSSVVAALGWAVNAYDATADDVRACVVIAAADQTHPIPPSLLT